MSLIVTVAPVVKNEIPAELVAIDQPSLVNALELAAKAAAMVPRTAADLIACNALFKEVDKLGKEIAAKRLELTRPIDDLKAKVIEAERQATIPLSKAREALGERMLVCQKELARIVAEERKKAEAEAKTKADAERARLEAERQEIIKKQNEEHEARVKAAEEERIRAEAEAAEQAEMFGTPVVAVVAEVIAPPPEPEPVAVVAEVIVATRFQEPPKLAVRRRVTYELDVFDPKALMEAACAAGGTLFGRQILVFDEKAVKALADAGCAVPGARLNEVSGMSGAGGKGGAA